MKIIASNDLVTLIAGFYATMFGRPVGDHDYTTEMLGVFDQLQQQAFPGYRFDPVQVCVQATVQLLGKEPAVRNYHPINLRFAPLARDDDPLVIRMGAHSTPAHPEGTLTIWTEDPAINARIQSVLEMVSEGEDTIS